MSVIHLVKALATDTRLGDQGVHIDPITRPPLTGEDWSPEFREAFLSPEMETYRDCLRLDGLNVRDSVLKSLSEYHHLPVEQVYEGCLHWEALSIAEWKSADRSTAAGVQDFYDKTQSWSFDLMWHSYLQDAGYTYPSSVLAARYALKHAGGRDHLDFGSGIGSTGQLFSRLGFNSTIADVSTPLIEYATWRCRRHGDAVKALNLKFASLPQNAFDVITALDALAHVTDFDKAVHDLHAALKPEGWLLANFDERAKSDGSAWHLHNNEILLEYRLRRAGFVRRGLINGVTRTYQKVNPASVRQMGRVARDTALLPVQFTRSFRRKLKKHGFGFAPRVPDKRSASHP